MNFRKKIEKRMEENYQISITIYVLKQWLLKYIIVIKFASSKGLCEELKACREKKNMTVLMQSSYKVKRLSVVMVVRRQKE